MPDTQRVGGSFRDPAGFVFTRHGSVFRQVNRCAAADYDLLMGSGLYDALVAEELLVAHDEVDEPPAAEDSYKVLHPQQIPFVSQPSEWCPGQLRDAALATLRIQTLAMDHGMSLRDASAFNVQFVRGRPVFIDTLSFGPLRANQPWVAYSQFCRHFLAPLALACLVDVRLGGLLRSNIDGIPLDLAAGLLPARTKMSPGLGVHLHAHARTQRRRGGGSGAVAATSSGRFPEQAFRGLLNSLSNTVEKLTWDPPASTWRDYDVDCPSYEKESHAAKAAIVETFVEVARPATVWDLGANTGRFSFMAAATGAEVVALEGDPSAVEVAWNEVRTRQASVLPLVMDLGNPTAAGGWAHDERPSLTDRGPSDLVFALALIHHLAIAGNVPLDQIVSWLSKLGRWITLEWVPKSDPMVQTLLAGRQDIFDSYNEDVLRKAIEAHAEIVRREPLSGSGRVLYLLRNA